MNSTVADTRRPRRALALGATLLLLMVGVLAGCGTDGGTAVRVGDFSFSMGQLDDLTEEYLEATEQTHAGLEDDQLSMIKQRIAAQLVVEQMMNLAADRLGVSVSERSVTLTVDELENSGQLNQGLKTAVIPPSRLENVVRWSLLRDVVGQALIDQGKTEETDSQTAATQFQADITRDVGVYVNPRIGSWNGTQLVSGGGQLVGVEIPPADADGATG